MLNKNNMENKTKNKNKNTSNIPICEIGNKKKNDCTKLIPLYISAAKQAYFLPGQNKKNTIYINDLETLNESSLTNNIDCLSNKDIQSFGDSISLIHSRKGSKADLFEDKNKNVNLQKYQDELFKKEKENIILKKEITDLKNNNNKLKEQESLNQTILLKINENYKNLEQILNNVKKEFNIKENEYLQQIEQLKNDIKNKDIYLNTIQEKLMFNNKIIDNLNKVIKEKDIKINELNKRLKKNQKYLKNNVSNVDINISHIINGNNNYSYSNNNKENENININKINNINNINNNKPNYHHEKQNKVNLKEFMKRYKLITEMKNQNLGKNHNTDTKRKIQNQIKTDYTYHDQGPPKQIKNYNFLEESVANIPKKLVKDMSLKKQLQLSTKMFKTKKKKGKNNENNSLKSLSNIQLDRNCLSKYTSMSYSSFSNKIIDYEPSTFDRKKIIYNCSNNNLIKDKKTKDVFLQRLYKFNRKIIKTSVSESTNSNLYSDGETSNNYYNQKHINNNKSTDYHKKNSTNNNVLRENFYRSSLKNMSNLNKKCRKSTEETPQNRRKLKNQNTDYENNRNINDSFLNEIHTDNGKKYNFINGKYKYKKPTLMFNNSIIDSYINLTNNKTTNTNTIKLCVRSSKPKDNHI